MTGPRSSRGELAEVVSMSRISLIAAMSLALSLSSCDADRSAEVGFSISMSDTGDIVLTDEHIATYVWEEHRILLTPKGVERWESFIPYDKSQEPPIPKLGGLTQKEFVVTLDGVEMYRGHFWSMTSSQLGPGVLLYDTLGMPRGEVRMGFSRLDETQQEDPRGRSEIQAHFRKQGKLRERP